MRKFRPQSIIQLILLGFLVVFFPIVLAVYQAFHSLDELGIKNSQNIQTAVEVTRNAQRVSEIVRDMERSLRQFRLLKSPEILDIFYVKLNGLDEALYILENQLPQTIQQENFAPFKAKIAQLRDLTRKGGEVERIAFNLPEKELNEAIELLRSLEPFTVKITGSSRDYADKIVEETHEIVTKFQEGLFLKSFTVIPATLLLVILFSVLIARPFRQLHNAITKLGDGQFTGRFRVVGPRDLRDLGTRLNWLGSRLGELDEQKKSFLRHMSHELKTPLAAMKEGGELLADEVPGPLNQKQHEVVAIINKSIQYFQNVIENLLDYNLLRSDESLHLNAVDIPALISEVLNSHRLTISRKDLKIQTHGPKLQVMADEKRIAVALDNLISNAINFSPRGDKIELRWEHDRDQFKLWVKDNGPGIDPSELSAVFAPFYQGKARRDGPIKGSGIGLSLAKECIKAHKGIIQAINQKKGACFIVEMPMNCQQGC